MSIKDSDEKIKVEGTATVKVYRKDILDHEFSSPTVYTTPLGVGIESSSLERIYLRHPIGLGDGRYEYPGEAGPLRGVTYVEADGTEHGSEEGHFTLNISGERTKKDGDFNIHFNKIQIRVAGIFRFVQ